MLFLKRERWQAPAGVGTGGGCKTGMSDGYKIGMGDSYKIGMGDAMMNQHENDTGLQASQVRDGRRRHNGHGRQHTDAARDEFDEVAQRERAHRRSKLRLKQKARLERKEKKRAG
jgi:hypothetical protein